MTFDYRKAFLELDERIRDLVKVADRRQPDAILHAAIHSARAHADRLLTEEMAQEFNQRWPVVRPLNPVRQEDGS